MENKLNKLLDAVKKDRSQLIKLKELAVSTNQYELAMELRKIETELWPKSDPCNPKRIEAKIYSKALALVNTKVDEPLAFILLQTAKKVIKHKDQFDLMMSSKIIAEKNEIYGE